jgi:acetyl esterase/lipase
MIHGGGWERGSQRDVEEFVPYFTTRSYTVANIGYRLAAEAKAPAAAEDVRNAIEWVRSRARDWGANPSRMLLVGFSAGAHLALLSAVAPPSVIGGPRIHAMGIVSFWGITDVADLVDGNHARDFAQHWLPETADRLELARTMSPISYDMAEVAAVCALHSVHDDVVPFAQSEKMIAKLHKANRPAKLISLSHKGHAAPPGDYPGIFRQLFVALEDLGVMG